MIDRSTKCARKKKQRENIYISRTTDREKRLDERLSLLYTMINARVKLERWDHAEWTIPSVQRN